MYIIRTMSEKKTLNITELAEYISIPKRTLFDQIRAGQFPVEPLKGLQPRRWSRELVDAWLRGTYEP